MIPIRETYYAIRVGEQENKYPYFKVGMYLATPMLFMQKKCAVAHMSTTPGSHEKIVRVELREVK